MLNNSDVDEFWFFYHFIFIIHHYVVCIMHNAKLLECSFHRTQNIPHLCNPSCTAMLMIAVLTYRWHSLSATTLAQSCLHWWMGSQWRSLKLLLQYWLLLVCWRDWPEGTVWTSLVIKVNLCNFCRTSVTLIKNNDHRIKDQSHQKAVFISTFLWNRQCYFISVALHKILVISHH